jgi:hypothetical protein
MAEEMTSIKINSDLLDGINLRSGDLSFNKEMEKLSKKENYIGRQMYRIDDILGAANMIKDIFAENPNITNEEIEAILKRK